MAQNTVLITGASSGIGYELAKCFARDGYALVVVARRSEALHRLAADMQQAHGVPVTVIVKDLTQPAAAAELVDELQREGIQLDVVVNNAGFGIYGHFAQTELATELEMMQINMGTLTQLTKLVLPDMLRRREGKILNVASTSAFQPGPLMAVYYATKAYVLSLSEALANELRGSGVSVTALCPGITRSGFQARAGMEGARLVRGTMMDAATVARIGYQGLMRKKTVVIPGFKNWLLVWFIRFTPRNVVTRIVRLLQERPSSSG